MQYHLLKSTYLLLILYTKTKIETNDDINHNEIVLPCWKIEARFKAAKDVYFALRPYVAYDLAQPFHNNDTAPVFVFRRHHPPEKVLDFLVETEKESSIMQPLHFCIHNVK